jgi:hypothetical protein
MDIIMYYIKHRSGWGVFALVWISLALAGLTVVSERVYFFSVDPFQMNCLLNSLKNDPLLGQQLLEVVVPINTLSAQHQIIQISEIYKFSIPDSEMLYQYSQIANQPIPHVIILENFPPIDARELTMEDIIEYYNRKPSSDAPKIIEKLKFVNEYFLKKVNKSEKPITPEDCTTN